MTASREPDFDAQQDATSLGGTPETADESTRARDLAELFGPLVHEEQQASDIDDASSREHLAALFAKQSEGQLPGDETEPDFTWPDSVGSVEPASAWMLEPEIDAAPVKARPLSTADAAPAVAAAVVDAPVADTAAGSAAAVAGGAAVAGRAAVAGSAVAADAAAASAGAGAGAGAGMAAGAAVGGAAAASAGAGAAGAAVGGAAAASAGAGAGAAGAAGAAVGGRKATKAARGKVATEAASAEDDGAAIAKAEPEPEALEPDPLAWLDQLSAVETPEKAALGSWLTIVGGATAATAPAAAAAAQPATEALAADTWVGADSSAGTGVGEALASGAGVGAASSAGAGMSEASAPDAGVGDASSAGAWMSKAPATDAGVGEASSAGARVGEASATEAPTGAFSPAKRRGIRAWSSRVRWSVAISIVLLIGVVVSSVMIAQTINANDLAAQELSAAVTALDAAEDAAAEPQSVLDIAVTQYDDTVEIARATADGAGPPLAAIVGMAAQPLLDASNAALAALVARLDAATLDDPPTLYERADDVDVTDIEQVQAATATAEEHAQFVVVATREVTAAQSALQEKLDALRGAQTALGASLPETAVLIVGENRRALQSFRDAVVAASIAVPAAQNAGGPGDAEMLSYAAAVTALRTDQARAEEIPPPSTRVDPPPAPAPTPEPVPPSPDPTPTPEPTPSDTPLLPDLPVIP